MLRWPDRDAVHQAAKAWAQAQSTQHPELMRLGYFGSYARGDWGVGSDLDLVAVIRESDKPFESRALDWPVEALPVPAEIRVYTQAEWARLQAEDSRLAKALHNEVVWIFERTVDSGLNR